MRCFLLFLFGFIVSSVRAQSLQFTFAGDSTTVPFVRDSLRGISGMEIVPATGEWHLVSDRGYRFVFTNVRTIRDLGDPSRLKTAQQTPFWFEGIRYDARTATYYWADEHDATTSVLFGKSVSDSAGRVLLRIPLPYHNKGVEGLAVTPSGALWVAPEVGWEGETRMRDDSVTFFRYPNPGATEPELQRFTYRIDRCAFAQKEERLGGISEILAVDDGRLLVLERCYDAAQKRVTANLYVATVDEASHTLRKDLAFDFNRQFPGPVCNVEAMAWADDSHQTLVIMADDNFKSNPTLRNQVLVLRRR